MEPTPWTGCSKAEKYFSFWDIAEEQRIDIASFYMVGQALSWFQWMHKNQQLSSWRAFTIALEQRFGPSTYVNHRAALFKLTQRTTVAAYQSEFETLSNRVTNLPPEALLDCFISGLKSSIQSELAILKPTTLSDAIALAKLVEEKFQGMRPLNPKPSLGSHLAWASVSYKPFLLLLADDPTDAIEEGGDAETVVETCEHTLNEITTEPEPEISLHALEGITGPRTFRLHASINRQPFTTLIDTGSSHNYLQPRLANFLHLPIDRTTQFPVVVGNGEKIHSEGTCPHVKFEMQGAEFEADFHVLEFAGADAILGIQWLEGLGKVVTDHKDLTMEFEHKDETPIEALDKALLNRETLLAQLKMNLQRAQERMREQTNRHRRDKEFQVGDSVYVKLKPYRQGSVALRRSHKLAKRYYGPYPIIARVGKVAYRLLLPSDARIHPVFHVSLLKFCPNPTVATPTHPPATADQFPSPLRILDKRSVKENKKQVRQVLVQWVGTEPAEATWEYWAPFHASFPNIGLEDKATLDGVSNDTLAHADNEGHPTRNRRQTILPVKLRDYICE
nr:hypothetical protein KK1_029709 [Ipomoea trifida]